MSVLTVQAWKCDKCGHVWLADPKPKRCSKCKSSTWDGVQVKLTPNVSVATVTKVDTTKKTIYISPENRINTPKAVDRILPANGRVGQKCPHNYMSAYIGPECTKA